MSNKYKKNNLIAYWLVLILIIEIFILIPTSLYLGNISEFSDSLLVIFQWYKIPVLIFSTFFILINMSLKGKLHEKYLSLLSAIAFLFWLFGFVIFWDYGLLNGTTINWSENSWRGWIDITIWIVVITASLMYSKRFKKIFIPISSFLVIAQLLIMLFTAYPNRDEIFTKSIKVNGNDSLRKIYQFSSQYNVLHLFLDGYQSDIFDDLINYKGLGKIYKDSFVGFTFFDETISAFPYTRFSIPSFIGNKIYDNKISKDSFVKSVFEGESVFNIAHKNNMEIDIVTEEYWMPFFTKGIYNNSYTLKGKGEESLKTTNAVQIFDLTLFRLAPYFIKRYIHNDQKWLFSSLFTLDEKMNYRYFSHTKFFEDFTKNLTVSNRSPVYKMIHIMNTHNPMVVNKVCEYAGGTLPTTRFNLTIQSKCTLDLVYQLFEKMKELGIYNNTLIVVHADHGGWVTAKRFNQAKVSKILDKPILPSMVSLASPLLAIKPINSKGQFNVSHKLVSLTDIPDTISTLMNWKVDFGSESVFTEKNSLTRTRKYYFYYWQKDAWTTDYTGPIYEYYINGSHYDTPWELNNIIYPPQK